MADPQSTSPAMHLVRRRPNFAAMPYELVDDETISPQAKTIYVILDRYADYVTGATFVGKDRVAAKAGFKKPDSIDKYLRELKTKGWITWERRWKRATSQRDENNRTIFEYSASPGKGFEPTTNLYVVNDRVEPPAFIGGGVPATGGTPVPATGGVPVPATGGTNKNQVNENQVYQKDIAESGDSATGKPTVRIKYPPEFNALWNMYPKRTGSKKRAYAQYQKALKRVSYEELQTAIHDLSDWVKRNHKDPKYVVDAERWFRDDRWDDELIDEQPHQNAPRRPNTMEAWLGIPEGTLGQQGTFGGFDALRDNTIDGQVIDQKELGR